MNITKSLLWGQTVNRFGNEQKGPVPIRKGPLTILSNGKGPVPAAQKEHIANMEQIEYGVPSR